MPISDKNLKYETALHVIALGLLSEMDGGKELVQMLFENAFSLVERSDEYESKKILKAIEMNRGISQDLGTEEIFQELTADLSKKLKKVLQRYYGTKKSWSKEMKVRVTSI
jgi:hypothetical protein